MVVKAVLGIDIGGTKTAAGVVDADGRLHGAVREATPRTLDPEELFDFVRELAERAAGRATSPLEAVGVGCGGPMRFPDAVVSPLHIPAWRAFPLRARLERALGLPAVVDNDARAFAPGQARFGAGRGARYLLGMVVSTGAGGGVVEDGRLRHGASGNAGHVGHVVVSARGPRCDCGARGCVTAYASGPGLAARAQTTFGHVTAAGIAAAAAAGDPRARATPASRISRPAAADNVLDLDRVVVGGGVSQAGDVAGRLPDRARLLPGPRQRRDHRLPRVIHATHCPVPYAVVMPDLAHTAEIEVGAPPDEVWRAIIDPRVTSRYVYGCEIEGEWRAGAPWRYHGGGRTVIGGTVLEARPPHVLRLTAQDEWYPGAADEPPYRITWRVEPVATGRSRVQLTFDGFETQGASYRNNADLTPILDGLRVQVDPDVAAALRRLDEIGDVDVRPLAPERLDDFLDLFDNRAFADNPSWRACYCFNFRFAGDEAEAAGRTGADNRRDMSDAIAQRGAHGLLAYAGGQAVGWCSASPKAEMPQLVRRDWMPPESERVGIIGCLVVEPRYRRHGVARALVAAAGDYLAGIGCAVAEAYPVKDLHGDAHGFYGPLEIYHELGYETYRDLPQRLVVRKRLTLGR